MIVNVDPEKAEDADAALILEVQTEARHPSDSRHGAASLSVLCLLSLLFTLGALACSSDSGGGTAPSPPVVGSTVTIQTSGVTPKNLQVAPGAQVTFVNNDRRNHEIASDPHPEHTDCPAINQVGVIVPGQSKQTGNLNTAMACGYHDHSDAQNSAWQGKITIQ